MSSEIVPIPTVREADGLALSSRNVYLSPEERKLGLLLSQALFAGQGAAPDGPVAVLRAARAVFSDADVSVPSLGVNLPADGDEDLFALIPAFAGSDGRMEVDYLTLRMANLSPAIRPGPARLLVAARVGTTRLLDNIHIELSFSGTGRT